MNPGERPDFERVVANWVQTGLRSALHKRQGVRFEPVDTGADGGSRTHNLRFTKALPPYGLAQSRAIYPCEVAART